MNINATEVMLDNVPRTARIGSAMTAFGNLIGGAWGLAQDGHYKSALSGYRLAEKINPFGGSLSPEHAILRHRSGEANGGCIESIDPTEDSILSFLIETHFLELPGLVKIKMPVIDGKKLEKNIKTLLNRLEIPDYHYDNIKEKRPHVMVLSTGRCGTVSLLKLLKRSNFTPYHTYWWQLDSPGMWWMQAAIMHGKGWREPAEHWLKARAAEWLGPKPMMGLNHMDTIFTPVFAKVHPKSKFVHLYRSPEDVFKSFYCKNQFLNNQLMPFAGNVDDGFVIQHIDVPLVHRIAWFIKFTDTFVKAFGRVMGPDRFLEISAEKLFSSDRDEIKKLLDFTNCGVSVDDALEHYKTKINEKKHKDVVPLEPGLTEFREVFATL